MKISCIIPCYNYAHFLKEAVCSVTAQTLPASEIIIIDDCSEDDTEQVAKELITDNPQIRYVKNRQNLGLVENFNKGVRAAQSEYICILGADDTLQPEYFDECASILEKQSHISIAYSDLRLFGARAEDHYNTYLDVLRDKDDQDYIIHFPDFGTENFYNLFNNNTNVINTSAVYKKEIFDHLGGYQNHYQLGIPEDYDFFKRAIAAGYQAAHIAKPLLNYRHHSDTQSNVQISKISQQIFYKDKHDELLKELLVLSNKIEVLKEDKSKLLNEIAAAREFINRKESEITELKKALNEKSSRRLLKKISNTFR